MILSHGMSLSRKSMGSHQVRYHAWGIGPRLYGAIIRQSKLKRPVYKPWRHKVCPRLIMVEFKIVGNLKAPKLTSPVDPIYDNGDKSKLAKMQSPTWGVWVLMPANSKSHNQIPMNRNLSKRFPINTGLQMSITRILSSETPSSPAWFIGY